MNSGGLLHLEKDIAEIAKKLATETLIAWDTEFIRETTFFPKLAVIQVATETESWVIDASGSTAKKRLKPLLDIFTDPKITKVAHAAQGDQECLHAAFGMVATPLFDTSAAA